MKFRILGSIVLTFLAGLPLFSLAEECPKGRLCNILEGILKDKGGPFGGMASGGSSLSQLQFRQKAACELAGSRCTDEQRLGCSRIAPSVIHGATECWNINGRDFKIVDFKTGGILNHRSFEVASNLANNNTDRNVVVARSANFGTFLFNGQGQEIANGEVLGCEDFKAAGEGKIACLRKGERFILRVDDLEKARVSSVKLDQVADKVAINLCSVALNEIATSRAQGNFVTRIFHGKSKTFSEIGESPVKIKTHDQGFGDLSSSCSMEPDTQRKCSSIYLTKKGLECYNYGSLVYIKPFKTSTAYLQKAIKKYVFNNREIVKMEDVYRSAENIPKYLEILRPDELINSTNYITSASPTTSVSPKGVQ